MSNGNAASEKSDLQEDANDTRSTSRKNSVGNGKSGAPSGDDLTDNLKAEKDCAQIDPLVPSDEYPDGGLRAWLVVFGAMCNTFSTFGYVNAWGVFQAYYEKTLLKDQSPSSIAWIGSIQYSLIFIPGLVVGRMFDLGYFKIPFFVASCLLVVATFLIAECTEYWHFLLCQGFAVGLGCGMIFAPALSVISHWFKKRRGIALGLTATGSSVGGTVFPIAANMLIKEVGFKWTMRIFGFILILTLGLSNLTLRRRLPPVKSAGGVMNLKAFKNPAFTVYSLSGLVTFLGLYTVLTYIDVSATYAGIDPNFSFYLISIANAGSGFGRIISGLLADRVGALNVMAPSTLLAGILTFAWPFATTKPSLIAVAIIYGIGTGAYVSLLAAPMIAFGEIEDVGRRVGMAMTIIAIGALAGPPISGAINRATGGYDVVGFYAGSTVVVSVALMLLSRHLHLKQLWGKF